MLVDEATEVLDFWNLALASSPELDFVPGHFWHLKYEIHCKKQKYPQYLMCLCTCTHIPAFSGALTLESGLPRDSRSKILLTFNLLREIYFGLILIKLPWDPSQSTAKLPPATTTLPMWRDHINMFSKILITLKITVILITSISITLINLSLITLITVITS